MKYLLVILNYAVALVAVFKEELPPRYKEKKKTLVVLLVAFLSVTMASQVYLECQTAKEKRHAKWSGRLRSPVRTQREHPVLKLGGSGLVYKGEPNRPVYTIAQEPLTVSLTDGRAELSLVIRDKNGIILAAIRNNEWFIAGPPVTLDRNFNESSLEAIDPKGDVIFQLQVYGEEVRLAGTFYNVTGADSVTLRPWLAETPSGRLFKYPSSEHPGELATD